MLPTRGQISLNLYSQYWGTVSCPFCGNTDDSLHHLLFSCSFSRVLWHLSPWHFNIEPFWLGTVQEWIQSVLDAHSFQLFTAVTMDFLWMACNKLVHEDVLLDPNNSFGESCAVIPNIWESSELQ